MKMSIDHIKMIWGEKGEREAGDFLTQFQTDEVPDSILKKNDDVVIASQYIDIY